MTIPTVGNRPQVQSLTTALKNICRDYPAGGTVLRELLQNADDARATELRFVLDETFYPTDKLLDDQKGKLEQYQGPALLAYNDATFKERDFQSISQIGNSLKIDDGTTTGRFGRGFNSVYNWTDSPSIVSADRLYILDPHMEWSGGGPRYDFVKFSHEAAMENQMKAFGRIMQHIDRPLDGTIIRIPLRNESRATKSEISSRSTTTSELADVLRTFALEFSDSGLLFLKNVEKLSIELDGESYVIEMMDRDKIREHKSKINNAVEIALRDSSYTFNCSFETSINYTYPGGSKTNTFVVQNRIDGAGMNETLRKWSEEQKFTPWVAVAAQIPLQHPTTLRGSLYTVLPLPVPTAQPVQIHASFSLFPDRARLQLGDTTSQDRQPAMWNEWLFTRVIPPAWADLLACLSQLYPNDSAFDKWPKSNETIANHPLNSATTNILKIINDEARALWPTATGYVSTEKGLLATGTESVLLMEALVEAQVPVVYVPAHLSTEVMGIFADRMLSPKTLCADLSSRTDVVKQLADSLKLSLVEFMLSEADLTADANEDMLSFLSEILRSRLKSGIDTTDRRMVDDVLSCIQQHHSLSEFLLDDLRGLSCVLNASDEFVLPSTAICPPKPDAQGCQSLQPYLSDVDRNFWRTHEKLLAKLGVRQQLELADLLSIQEILESKITLAGSDVAVAIEILKKAVQFKNFKIASVSRLKVLTEDMVLLPIKDVNFDDLGNLKHKTNDEVNLAHPDIPLSILQRLGMVGTKERMIKGMLELEDVDDPDEFDQQENAASRIADTLNRYPIETTFKEYLANADDAGASELNWLLDEREHTTKDLLTPKMAIFQGPALLAHNNAVFSDDDLKGFKSIGEGSKSQDKTTIGQFGRGSQTMYHFSDAPMILTAKWLLILEPQRKYLPRNKYTRMHMSGVKLSLSKLREACHGQLAPFEGLWEYSQNLENYPGTIFRFPLRKAANKSSLGKGTVRFDDVSRLMNDYFKEARISLLFLRNVQSISFEIQGSSETWSVTRTPQDASLTHGLISCSISRQYNRGTPTTGEEKWWFGIEDLTPKAELLPTHSRRVAKNIECGIAGLVSSNVDLAFGRPIQSRMFTTLPLPFQSNLGVHIHATFALTGDRRTISVNGDDQQSKWNRLLLEEALPAVYLDFLDTIGSQVKQNVFEYWPKDKPLGGSVGEVLTEAFWNKLSESDHRLFPKAELSINASLRRKVQFFSLRDAVFDFLPQTQSAILGPILLDLGMKLVRGVLPNIEKRLKLLPTLATISGQLLRALFKSEKSKECLMVAMANGMMDWNLVLPLLIPEEDAMIDELDGCHILPIMDGTLGTMKIISTTQDTPRYLSVSAKEAELFSFASQYFVEPCARKHLLLVENRGRFNLQKLKLCDVPKLLKSKPISAIPTEDEDKWLIKFWKFWDLNGGSAAGAPSVDDLGAKLFRAVKDCVSQYFTPFQFSELPAIVNSSDPAQRQLCQAFPGLYIFDSKFMPEAFSKQHSCLKQPAAFDKFIRGLKQLPGPSKQSGLEDFVRLKVLRDLVVYHINTSDILSANPRVFPELEGDLKRLPLWHPFTASSEGKYRPS